VNFGGPVWHASASLGRAKALDAWELRNAAVRALAGVGDAKLGEWMDVTEIAVHLRRRLSHREQLLVGPVVDIRGTPEAAERVAVVAKQCPNIPVWKLAENEL